MAGKKTETPASTGTEVAGLSKGMASIMSNVAVGDDNDERGSEAVGTKDLQIPRVDLLQDLSPQIKEDEDVYIPGAKPGLLYNTLTGEIYGDNCVFIPIFYAFVYNLWIDRKKGGGFRGSYPTEALAKAEIPRLAKEEELTEGSYGVVETAINYVYVVKDDGTVEEASIAFARTKLAASRKLNSLVRLAGGARWRRAFTLKSAVKKNNKGTFYVFDVEPIGYINEDMYKRASDAYDMFSKSFAEGKLNTNFDHDEEEEGSAGNGQRQDSEI